MANKDFIIKNGLQVTGALSATPSSINLSTGLVGTTASFSGALSAGATTLTGALSGTTATFSGSLTVSTNNATGGGLILADDGDIVDMNTGYAAMRFSSGVQIYSAKRGGSPVITLGSNGSITASGPLDAGETILTNIVSRNNILANGYISVVGPATLGTITVRAQNNTNEGGEIKLNGAYYNNSVVLDNLSGTLRIFNGDTGAVPFTVNFYSNTGYVKLYDPWVTSTGILYELYGSDRWAIGEEGGKVVIRKNGTIVRYL